MRWIDGEGFLRESSGKTYNCVGGIVGLTRDLYVTEGSDGGIGHPEDFTQRERAELAGYMIGLWRQFGETA